MWRLFLVLAAASTAACGQQGSTLKPQASSASGLQLLQEAEDAYFRFDLDAARQAFRKCLQEPSSPPPQRAEAARRLAAIAWRFDEDWSRAISLLDQAEKWEGGAFENAAARSRLMENQGRIEQAFRSAQEAIRRAASNEEKLEAAAAAGRLVLRQVRQSTDFATMQDTLQQTLAGLLESLRADPGWLEASRTALGLALAADDGPAALEAWRSYYWVPSSGQIPPSWPYGRRLADPHAVLSRELPNWAGSETALEVRARVVQALADSFFFAEAAWLAADPRIDPSKQVGGRPEIAQVVAYSRFLDTIRRASRDFYRRRALELAPAAELRRKFEAEARRLWPRLDWPGAPPPFSETAFMQQISERFGTEVAFRSHHGTQSLIAAHRLIDEKRPVRQYGRQAEVRLVVLDHLASGSYTTWYWDGRAATGGWVSEKGIVQLRPAYSDGPLRAWNQISDPVARRELEEEIARKSAADDAIARADPYAYLPGLALRMRRQSHLNLLAELRSQGLRVPRLREAFVLELQRLARASSIDAHEGRHALDRRDAFRNAFRSGADKEFRAKLSEVALAPDPRLALTGGILSANIGDGSSHGQANLRIMQGLVGWMRENASQIQALDASRPLLPQLDLLTDQQLREAFRSMDPWAN